MLNLRDLNLIVTGKVKFNHSEKLNVTTGRSLLTYNHSFLSRFKLKRPKEWKEDEFEIEKTPYFKVEVDVYINESSKQYQKSLMTFLESLTSDTKRARFLRGRTRFSSKDVFKLFNLPYNPTLQDKNSEVKFYNPSTADIAGESRYTMEIDIPVGKLIQEGREYKEFGLSFKDLKKGGIIAGAIGSGKTNFRLNLIDHLIRNDIHILDFDLKGDAGKQQRLLSNGTNIVFGEDIQLNPFQCPTSIDKRSYIDMMYRSFVETIPDKETLTPPQLNLLYLSIKSTVEADGDALEFLENILIHSMIQADLIDNYQEATAQALLNKFNWLHTILRDVFWVKKSSFSPKYFNKQSSFFDFSRILQKTPISLIRFLLNFILTQFTLSLESNESETYSKPNHVIFIDEGQLLMPKNKDPELTKLEEVVVTLRSKGVSVISGGVSADLMSNTLLDSGLIVQFRTSSTKLSRSLSLTEEQMEMLTSLNTFECVIRAESTINNPVLVKTNLFNYSNKAQFNNLRSNKDGNSVDSEINNSICEDFELNKPRIMKCRLIALFPELLTVDTGKRRIWSKGIFQWLSEIEIAIFEEFVFEKLKFKDILQRIFPILRKSFVFDDLLKEYGFTKFLTITIYQFMMNNDEISNLFPQYQRNFRTAIRSINFKLFM